MHLHVGYNIPGYLPEAAVYCTDDPITAREHLQYELKSYQGDLYEQCEYGAPECECDSCEQANTISGILHELAVTDVSEGIAFRSDYVWWIEAFPDPIEECDISELQF